jgi:hypothetical protein
LYTFGHFNPIYRTQPPHIEIKKIGIPQKTPIGVGLKPTATPPVLADPSKPCASMLLSISLPARVWLDRGVVVAMVGVVGWPLIGWRAT